MPHAESESKFTGPTTTNTLHIKQRNHLKTSTLTTERLIFEQYSTTTTQRSFGHQQQNGKAKTRTERQQR